MDDRRSGVHLACLYDLLKRVSEDYDAPPLRTTENGAAFDDVVDPDGDVHDPQRIAYLDAHVRAAHGAIADGGACGGVSSGRSRTTSSGLTGSPAGSASCTWTPRARSPRRRTARTGSPTSRPTNGLVR
ncbi:hypothetical protein GCM10009616_13650 [Microlunatus lacustris]